MALSLGQLLGGAGRVSAGMRQAEEAERVARENQLKIEEQNRLAAMKARISQQQFPSLEPMAAAAPQMPQFQFQQMPQRQMPVPAAPTPTAMPEYTKEDLAPGRTEIVSQPVTMTGPAPAVVPTLQGVSPQQVSNAQQNYALRAMQLRDAIVGLERLRGREGVPERMLKNQEELVARQQQQLQFAQEGLSRLVPTAQPQPVAPQPVVSTTPTAPETVVTPAVQAQRDQEAARIRAQELGTVERADAELRTIEAELKRTKEATSKQILQQQRDMVKAARDVLAAAPAAAPATVAAPTPAPAAVAPQATLAPVAQNVANAVLNSTAQLLQTNPAQLSQAMQDTQAYAAQQRELMTRQRNDAARLAQIYMQSGTADGITQGRQLMSAVGQADLALQQFDKQMRESMIYMQGMQGLQEFAATNNPARLSGIWSYYSAAPVGVQPRSDGRFDLFFDGQLSEEGLSKAQIQERAQLAMFQSARDAVAKSAALVNELALKQRYSDAQINAVKDIWLAVINGQAKIAEELAKANNGKLTTNTATGQTFYQKGNDIFILSNQGIEVPGVGTVQQVQAQPVQFPGR